MIQRSRRRLLASAGIVAASMMSVAPARRVDAQAAAPRGGAGRRKLGVALGSGSHHGLAHLGVIRAFERRALVPDVITGTSAGAIAGGLWAWGMNAERIRELTAGLSWGGLPGISGLGRGLLSNRALAELIAEHTRGSPIESFRRPFAAIATDFATGERVLLDRGPAATAIQASASIPVMYAPVSIGGRELVDGALSEPVPVRAARALGAERVIAIDVAYRPHEGPVGGLFDSAFQMMHILVNRLITEQIREADLAIRLDLHHHFTAGDPPEALIDAGARAVDEAWPRIEALLRR